MLHNVDVFYIYIHRNVENVIFQQSSASVIIVEIGIIYLCLSGIVYCI